MKEYRPKKRINVMVPVDLLAKVGEFVKEAEGLDRSKLFCVAAEKYLSGIEKGAAVKGTSMILCVSPLFEMNNARGFRTKTFLGCSRHLLREYFPLLPYLIEGLPSQRVSISADQKPPSV